MRLFEAYITVSYFYMDEKNRSYSSIYMATTLLPDHHTKSNQASPDSRSLLNRTIHSSLTLATPNLPTPPPRRNPRYLPRSKFIVSLCKFMVSLINALPLPGTLRWSMVFVCLCFLLLQQVSPKTHLT